MISVSAIIITIFLGPFMFWMLSRFVFVYPGVKRFPTQLNDAIGDIVFLPLFNGILFGLMDSIDSFDVLKFGVCIAFSLIFTGLYVQYQLRADFVDWSKPKRGVLNYGGWYHALFMVFQMALVFYGLMNFLDVWLWLMVFGYVAVSVVQYLKYGYI